MRQLVLACLRLYQKTISPDHGWLAHPARRVCRFSPTCSEYMMEAISNHGIMTGSYLGIRRLLRCHPFHPGGSDPVPRKPYS